MNVFFLPFIVGMLHPHHSVVFVFVFYRREDRDRAARTMDKCKIGGVEVVVVSANNEQTQDPLRERRLFVSNLAFSTNDETLMNVYGEFGELEDCAIIKERARNGQILEKRSKGYGFVVYRTAEQAQMSLENPRKIIDGR